MGQKYMCYDVINLDLFNKLLLFKDGGGRGKGERAGKGKRGARGGKKKKKKNQGLPPKITLDHFSLNCLWFLRSIMVLWLLFILISCFIQVF